MIIYTRTTANRSAYIRLSPRTTFPKSCIISIFTAHITLSRSTINSGLGNGSKTKLSSTVNVTKFLRVTFMADEVFCTARNST